MYHMFLVKVTNEFLIKTLSDCRTVVIDDNLNRYYPSLSVLCYRSNMREQFWTKNISEVSRHNGAPKKTYTKNLGAS